MAEAYILQKLFFDLDADEVREIRTEALALIREQKTIMSVSGGGKSGQKQFTLPPAQILFEANAALRHLSGTRRRFTVSRYTGLR